MTELTRIKWPRGARLCSVLLYLYISVMVHGAAAAASVACQPATARERRKSKDRGKEGADTLSLIPHFTAHCGNNACASALSSSSLALSSVYVFSETSESVRPSFWGGWE